MGEVEALLSGLARANFHKGGVKCLRLFRIEPAFFAQLVDDTRRFVEAQAPSRVGPEGHVTSWTRPFGPVAQYSLLNRSGDPADTSADHDPDLRGKRFHRREAYPTLAAFVAAFPQAANMRLNGLGVEGGLSPHEEHILRERRRGGTCWLTVRFHLPVLTNPAVEVLLDGELFRLEAGSVFLFNNGCVHAAVNHGREHRYHLVWDMPLGRATYDLMFGEGPAAAFLQRVRGDDRRVAAHRRQRVPEYETYGPARDLYDRLRLQRLGLRRGLFQRLYNDYDYVRYRLFERVSLHGQDAGLGA